MCAINFSRPLRDCTHLLILPRTSYGATFTPSLRDRCVLPARYPASLPMVLDECFWVPSKIDRSKNLIWTSLILSRLGGVALAPFGQPSKRRKPHRSNFPRFPRIISSDLVILWRRSLQGPYLLFQTVVQPFAEAKG